jgi:hypothetical protein
VKISSMSAYDSVPMHESHQLHVPFFSGLIHALRTFFMRQDQLKIAIALSEANDVEGAKALLDERVN